MTEQRTIEQRCAFCQHPTPEGTVHMCDPRLLREKIRVLLEENDQLEPQRLEIERLSRMTRENVLAAVKDRNDLLAERDRLRDALAWYAELGDVSGNGYDWGRRAREAMQCAS